MSPVIDIWASLPLAEAQTNFSVNGGILVVGVILRELKDWVELSGSSAFLWISGRAGEDKSIIAQTIIKLLARDLEKRDKLSVFGVSKTAVAQAIGEAFVRTLKEWDKSTQERTRDNHFKAFAPPKDRGGFIGFLVQAWAKSHEHPFLKELEDYIQPFIIMGQQSSLSAALAQTNVASGSTTYGKPDFVEVEDEDFFSSHSTHILSATKHNSTFQTTELPMDNGRRGQNQDREGRNHRQGGDDYLACEANDRLSVIFILGTLLSGASGTLLASSLPPNPTAALKTALLALVEPQHNPLAIAISHAIWADVFWSLGLTLSLSSALLAVLARLWIHQCYLSPAQHFHVHFFHYTDHKMRVMEAIVATDLPLYIFFSLFLLMSGLVVFLWPLSKGVAIAIAVVGGGVIIRTCSINTSIQDVILLEIKTKNEVKQLLRDVWSKEHIQTYQL
ncbi:hypothetical protein BDP27DRAFT_1364757 [Rhodocollybia butyracea]|uniref:DUF6535 domain-containing protein n=1 Tax=Rhodocollybia butyracea TaxID=206335 RepID=A0A9P5U6B0_9AGAR|nr:hypothetical protein BDP27DRAFT_1364757 [Rhodocollybia butyracea]